MSDGPLGHLPPHSLEAERGVLGSILLDSECLLDVSLKLEPNHFYRTAHATIYRKMLDLWSDTGQCDVIMLTDRLTAEGEFEKLGGYRLLEEIMGCVPHAANVLTYVEMVLEKFKLRTLISASTDAIKDAYAGELDSNEILERAEQRIFALSQNRDVGQVYDPSEAIDLYASILDRRRQGEIEGLTTGFVDLDELLMGMRPKQLLILAARPGQGKTSLAMDIGWHVSSSLGQRVLMISLEMAIEELTERMVSSIAGIDSKRLKDPYLLERLSHDEDARVLEAMNRFRTSKLMVNDCVGQTVSQIASVSRRVKARDGLGLLIVDYLGKIRKPESRTMNTNDQITYISNALKELSGELRIPVLCLHQLNRESVKEGIRPQMHHLRDSGSLEQDADAVLLIHNVIPKDQMVGQVELIVDKNRGGPTGTVYLTYEKPYTRFSASAPQGVNGNPAY